MITLKKTQILIVEKKSKFITLTFPITTKEDFEQKLDNIRSDYNDARHIVYSYILNQHNYKYSDDGEPNGTAGKPICNVLIKNEIVYSAVVCIRYFGGIKLGANGLIRNYPKGLKKIIEDEMYNQYIYKSEKIITIDISKYNKNINVIKKYEHRTVFTDQNVKIIFQLTNDENKNFPEL